MIDQTIKEIAYKLDPECWVSYSGKAKGFKQYMEGRRTLSLDKAAKIHAEYELEKPAPAKFCSQCGANVDIDGIHRD